MSDSRSKSLLVSIVVPCRNEAAAIEGFLDEVLQQEAISGEWEVLVADGESDDGTRSLLEKRAGREDRLRVVSNPGRITSAALNIAIAQARGEYIVRMDVHTHYASDYVAACIRTIQSTGAQNVGGAARTQANGRMAEAIAAAYASPFAVGSASFHFPDHEGYVDTVTYGCWRRDYLQQLGGFDENLVRNQDDELNLRILRSGGRIWQSSAIRSWYVPRASLRRLFQQYYQYGFWKVAVLRKHGRPASWRHLVPGTFVLVLVALALAAPVLPVARLGLAFLLAVYALFLLTGSVTLWAKQRGWHALLYPVVLTTFHVSYGLGFLHGWLAWRGARRWATEITR